jgi:hypothetical protein
MFAAIGNGSVQELVTRESFLINTARYVLIFKRLSRIFFGKYVV